jgi:translation initiation factor 2 subunit 3
MNYINSQPIINIGCLGSVSDGKSSLVKCLTGTKTQKHSNEKIRNITIKQGYGNMKIWEDETTTNSEVEKDIKLINHISFVDCPGHHNYIQTMLSSLSIMDGAIFVIACDQPLSSKTQLIQQFEAIKLSNINKIIICLNKIDLVSKNILLSRKIELDLLLNKYNIEPYAIIPTSFNKNIGINYLIKAIIYLFNPYDFIKKLNETTIFKISRTFDINKPGTDWINLKGGVLGGTIQSGNLKIGDSVEILPGIVWKENNEFKYKSIRTVINSIKTDTINLKECISGGLIGLGTELDPYYCKNDMLLGNVLIKTLDTSNKVKVYTSLELIINILPNNDIININDILVLQIGTRVLDAKVISYNKNIFKLCINKPVCIIDNENILICKKTNNIIKVIGNGYIT